MSGSIIHIAVVDSTNIYTSKLLGQSDIMEWTMVVADSQTAGKGQRGKTWESEYGKNMLCTTYLKPNFLRIQEQFIVSAAVCLAVCNTLLDYGIEPQIKWPNDILVKSKKIAGVLIENQLDRDYVESSLVGVGLNVNQQHFNLYPWPATSMKRELNGLDVDLDELIPIFRNHFQTLMELGRTSKMIILSAYNQFLYAKGEAVNFVSANKNQFGILKGVTLFGEIVIQQTAGESHFVNGEIKLIGTFS
jgi:BirA family transcriptional regulator, biotin operon repressor / biotin---[acetyl-CoA-carboxylase] ligase